MKHNPATSKLKSKRLKSKTTHRLPKRGLTIAYLMKVLLSTIYLEDVLSADLYLCTHSIDE